MRRVTSFIALIMIIIFIGQTICAADETTLEGVPGGMILASSSDGMNLYYNSENASFAVTNSKTGYIWQSNPIQKNSENDVSSSFTLAQISIDYFTSKNENKTMNSYYDSVLNKGFTLEKIDKGFKVNFTFGKKVITKSMIPEAIRKSKFETMILSKITDKKELGVLTDRYDFVSLKDVGSDETKEQLTSKYPLLNTADLYILNKYTPDYAIAEIYDILMKYGYTAAEINKDNSENGIAIKTTPLENFTISIEYTLEKGSLVARIPCAQIISPKEFPLVNINLLPFFGAADVKEEGYMFIPDGSGALINYNNGKLNASPVSIPMYGTDPGKKLGEKFQYAQQAIMPVFGMKKEENAFIAVIEEGDAHASINSDIAGHVYPYNTNYASFNILPWDTVTFSGTSGELKNNVYQKKPYMGDIKVRYTFLQGNDANYSGMAKTYRNYLSSKGDITVLKPGGYRFVLENLGAIKKKKSFFGIPYTATIPLTTFKQSQMIMNELRIKGIKNIDLKFTGWFNGGINNKVPKYVNIESALGGRKNLTDLSKNVTSQMGKIYLDVALQNINSGFISLGFNAWTDSVHYTYKEIAINYPYSIVSMAQDRNKAYKFFLSPAKIWGFLNPFVTKVKKLDIGMPFYKDLGDDLISDFHTTTPIDRQEALTLISDNLKKTDMNYAISTGNIFSIKNAQMILELPDESSHFFLEDKSIPFVQMVLHGYTDYAGPAINLSDDYRTTMLKTVETGASPYYVWIFGDESELKNTPYNNYYAVNFRDWMDEAVEFYNRLSVDFSELRNVTILSHDELAPDVTCTTYENGVSVIVNYSRLVFTYMNVTIKPKDYTFIRGFDK